MLLLCFYVLNSYVKLIYFGNYLGKVSYGLKHILIGLYFLLSSEVICIAQLFKTCLFVNLYVSGHHSHVSQCPPNEFDCRGTDVCIELSKLCDGVPDCSDGRDEGPHCRGMQKG